MSGGHAVHESYLAAFETLARSGAGPAWLDARRRSAMARLQDLGFPTTRNEDWKYTNLSPIAGTVVRLPEPAEVGPEIERALLGDVPAAPRLVFVNGRSVPRLTSTAGLPAGVRVESLAEALARDGDLLERHLGRQADDVGDAFAALSSAFLRDGAIVHVPDGITVEVPIHLVFVASGTQPEARVLTQPRNLVVLGSGSRATLVERYVGPASSAHFTNAVTEVVAGEGAGLAHVRLQDESGAAFHVGTLAIRQARDSTFTSCALAFGGSLARNTIRVCLDGEGATTTLTGLALLAGRQHLDTHVTVDHVRPRCTSRQLYKGVLDDRARAVFNGRIVVRREAHGTDAHQLNKNLLLADGPEVDSKPWLEIFADDVKCSHGAADGQLAEEAIFYLESRGLDEAAARTLLTYGFANEVVERVPLPAIRAEIDTRVLTWLRARHAKELS